MASRDQTLDPFAKVAGELISLAQKLDPSRPATPLKEIAASLLQDPGERTELEHLFGSLSIDIAPYSAKPVVDVE